MAIQRNWFQVNAGAACEDVWVRGDVSRAALCLRQVDTVRNLIKA